MHHRFLIAFDRRVIKTARSEKDILPKRNISSETVQGTSGPDPSSGHTRKPEDFEGTHRGKKGPVGTFHDRTDGIHNIPAKLRRDCSHPLPGWSAICVCDGDDDPACLSNAGGKSLRFSPALSAGLRNRLFLKLMQLETTIVCTMIADDLGSSIDRTVVDNDEFQILCRIVLI